MSGRGDKSGDPVLRRTIGKNLPEMVSKLVIRSTPAGLMELIANSHDADAERVELTYKPGEGVFVIRDDGNGMLPQELEGFYRIGDSPKLQQPLSQVKKRKCLGEFGVATLVLKSLAEKYILTTRKDGLETVVTEDFDGELNAETNIPFSSRKVPKDQHGTTIELQGLKFKEGEGFRMADLLKKVQAQFRRLTQLKDFAIFVNGSKVSPTIFEGATKFNFDKTGKYMGHVTGTIYLAARRTDLRGVHIYVNKREIGDPQTILAELVNRNSMREKVIVDVEADALAGAVLFDRYLFRQDHKGYAELLRELRTAINEVNQYEVKSVNSSRSENIRKSWPQLLGALRTRLNSANLPEIKKEVKVKFETSARTKLSSRFDAKSNTLILFYGVGNLDPNICKTPQMFGVSMAYAAADALAAEAARRKGTDNIASFFEERARILAGMQIGRKAADTVREIHPRVLYTIPEAASISGTGLATVNYMDRGGMFEYNNGRLIGQSFLDAQSEVYGMISLRDFLEGRVTNISTSLPIFTQMLNSMNSQAEPFFINFGRTGSEPCYFVDGTCANYIGSFIKSSKGSKLAGPKRRADIFALGKREVSQNELLRMTDGISADDVDKVLDYAAKHKIPAVGKKGIIYGGFIKAARYKAEEERLAGAGS